MKKIVLVALEEATVFQSMVQILDREESVFELEISQNIESQATFLYFLPKIHPHVVVVSEGLSGELNFPDFMARVKQLAPETEIFVYRDDIYSIANQLLGNRDYLKKIITVWSPSGGVGKTEIAKNLALTAGSTHRVILVDANLCNPDIAGHLGIGYKKGSTLTAALGLWSENRLTPGALNKLLLPFDKIQVLVGPEDSIEQTDFSPVFFRDLLRVISQLADFVIVDIDSDITSPAGISILLNSHHVLTPFTTLTTTLGHGKVYLDLLKESYQMNMLKFDPILNRAGEGGKVTEEDIELLIKRPVLASISYDKTLLRSACDGTPLLIGKRPQRKKLFRTFQGIVQRYAQKEVRKV